MPESSFTGKHIPKHKPELGTWAAMNWLQKTGVIALLPLYFLSLICGGKFGAVLAMIAWSSVFLGYVAGNLWRYRHAVHFWWSVTFAFVVHAFLLPVYVHLTNLSRAGSGHAGKAYMQLSFGVLIAEVLVLLFLLKHIAMWLHRRTHPTWPEHNGGFQWTLPPLKDRN